MVLCVKTPVGKAQQVKRFLIENSLFDPRYRLKRTKAHIFFPVKKRAGIKRRFGFAELVDVRSLPKAREKKDIRSEVKKKLTKKETDHLRRAYDVIGDIAILEVPPELVKKQKIIADALLRLQKNVRTVLKKAGIHGTEFRTRPMKWLAGKKTKETIHREQGIRLRLNVETVYFSPRLATERKRIAQQVRPGERVLVMFSGCAPYPCVMAKNTGAKEIVGIEINPEGHDYGVENLRLNRIKNVTLINADVKDAVPLLKTKFDRIVMPLPKSAGDFLDTALDAAKKGAVIHFYSFEEKGNFKAAYKRIREVCKRANRKCRMMRTVRCGQQSPGTYRICVDFRVV